MSVWMSVCAKGLEQATGLRLSQVVGAERPHAAVAVLSGPSFALEVGKGLPTAVTIAAPDRALAQSLAESLASPAFRRSGETPRVDALRAADQRMRPSGDR